MDKRTIVVIGATGAQGKGVVNSLVENTTFHVKAVTRNPDKYGGKAQEVIKADLKDVQSLGKAFENAHGVFVVTNFWEGADELTQAKNAIAAAKNQDVEHFVWSTLPNVAMISGGEFEVPHFTGKANIDALVSGAGFKYHTFVQAPFYFQNLTGMMAAQPKDDGTVGWTLPVDPAKKAIHMGDINDLGKVVAGAFMDPEKVGNGAYLSLATELNSFNDILAAYAAFGKTYSFTQVPAEVFSSFFEGAGEISEMMGYFEKHSYMGPNNQSRIALASQVAIGEFVSLNQWIKQNN